MLPRSFYNCPAENQLDFGSWQGAVFLNIWCDDRLRDDTPRYFHRFISDPRANEGLDLIGEFFRHESFSSGA